MDKVSASRYHDISCGHRVYGHESKCANLHGHNYRIHFTVEADSGEANDLDNVGRVLDFSVIKSHLCMWLEDNWDHRFLVWKDDPLHSFLMDLDKTIVVVQFNPTAENMAIYLLEQVGPVMLLGTRAKLVSVKIEETRKCSVECKTVI